MRARLARNKKEISEAYALVERRYWETHQIEASKLHTSQRYRTKVLVVYDQNDKLLGTASLMFPTNGIFPGEDLFQVDFHKSSLPLDWNRTVEYGRLAIEPQAPPEVLLLIQKAFLYYGKRWNLSGFVAIVRTALGRSLRKSFQFETIPTCLNDRKEGSFLENLPYLGTYPKNENLYFIAVTFQMMAEGLSR
ncbi:hypothetical protein [Siphonobacter sp. SORGH_AS_1065]|uniref:N-acyl amino acid synthase FeeM domain-containing protein n=1 Tax=Siphonobacter sp. SORGH_AS_1065 TaxID=3041795 RepID=UPI0027862C7D|nr:hypothetical protein [Siphonobacter sp. SORGH_AS_1065]MDQ1090157.1 hypothetical protein [Siphonobacter sp. SORGH_AS_1065]